MNNIDVPKRIIAAIGAALLFASALLIVLASNENTDFPNVLNGAPVKLESFIMTLYSALCIVGFVWLYVKAFADKKVISAFVIIAFTAVSLFAIIYGIYSDKVSTGPFGAMGCVSLLGALAYAVIFIYKNGYVKICIFIEVSFLLINTVLSIGSIKLLGYENITKDAFILVIMPVFFALASAGALMYRFVKAARKKWFKIVIIALLVIGILSYTVCVAVALGTTMNYVIAFKLPTGLICSALIDGEVTVHSDFSGEDAHVGVSEMTSENHKINDSYFSKVNNYFERPMMK